MQQDLLKNFPVLYKEVTGHLAQKAHSTKAENKIDNNEDRMEVDSKPEPNQGTIRTYMNPTKLSAQQIIKIELAMFWMFICCALPWALMNSNFFIDFIQTLNPVFLVPDRTAFFPKHLVQETAAWSIKFNAFLKGKTNLTISLDGWSTRAKDEIYTFHTTTPKRRSFFTDGHIFKGISVTGDALLDVIVQVRFKLHILMILLTVKFSYLPHTMQKYTVQLQAMVAQMSGWLKLSSTCYFLGYSTSMIHAIT